MRTDFVDELALEEYEWVKLRTQGRQVVSRLKGFLRLKFQLVLPSFVANVLLALVGLGR